MNHVARYYETYWSEAGFNPSGAMWPGLERLYAANIRSGMRVLDLGCGDGRTSGSWLRARGCEYVGVDISRNGVEETRKLGLEAHQIEDASSLPFTRANFDAVVCIEVLEHLFAPAAAAAEIRRVLKPGGILIVTVPNVAAWRWRMDMMLLGRWNPIGDPKSAEEPWRDPHIRFFTVASLRRFLLTVGFELECVGGHGGGILMYLPYLRRFAGREASVQYRWLERLAPSIFAGRLHAVAKAPQESSHLST